MTFKKHTRHYTKRAYCHCCGKGRLNSHQIGTKLSFWTGYSSCFGDEHLVEGLFCVGCLMQLIGEYFHEYAPNLDQRGDVAPSPQCNRCALPIGDGTFEYQELVTFRHPQRHENQESRYRILEAVLCQHCVKELFGQYLWTQWVPLTHLPKRRRKARPLWAWHMYQLEQGWHQAQLWLRSY